MTAPPTDLVPLLLQGHVVDRLRELDAESVQCVITSPPYWGLRLYGSQPVVWEAWNYLTPHDHEWTATPPRRSRSEADATSAIEQSSVGGRNYDAVGGESCACGAWRGELGLEPTPQLYVQHLADVFDEVRRVLRRDGTVWLNLGDTYATHPAGVTDDRRWQSSGLHNRDHTATIQSGTMDKRAPGLKPKDLVGIPWRVAFELQDRGWWLRSDCVWGKPNPMPESTRDRPTRSHEYVFLLTRRDRYFYDTDGVRTPYSTATLPEIGEKYRGESTKMFRQYGAQDASDAKRSMIRSIERHGGANLKSVWWIPTESYPEAHFATFPQAIPEIAIRAGTSERGCCGQCGTPWRRDVVAEGGTPWRRDVVAEGGTIGTDEQDWHPQKGLELGRRSGHGARGMSAKSGDGTYRRTTRGWIPGCDHALEPVPCVVLDPFCGSGTVLQVARRLGRRSIGIDLKPEYVELARDRARARNPDLLAWSEAEGPTSRPVAEKP